MLPLGQADFLEIFKKRQCSTANGGDLFTEKFAVTYTRKIYGIDPLLFLSVLTSPQVIGKLANGNRGILQGNPAVRLKLPTRIMGGVSRALIRAICTAKAGTATASDRSGPVWLNGRRRPNE